MKSSIAKSLALGAALLAVPSFAFAQSLQPLMNLVASVNTIVGRLIPLIIAIAMVVFFWGLITYIRGSGKGHKSGKRIMIAGLVSLFVMVSVWGIINLAGDALGTRSYNNSVTTPRVPGVGDTSNPSDPNYDPLRPLPGATSGPGTYNWGEVPFA